jgi:zinc protease
MSVLWRAVVAGLIALATSAGRVFGAIETVVLPNRTTLVVIAEPDAPAVTLAAAVRVGVDDEGPEPGIAALTARLLGVDAEGRTSVQMEADRDAFGAFGADYDGCCITAWTVSAPVDLETAAQTLLLNVLTRPRFSEEVVAAGRERLRRELALERDDPLAQTLIALRSRALGSSQRPLGTEDSVRALTVEGVRAFHHRFVRPERTVIVVHGPVTLAQVRPLVEALLGIGGWDELLPLPTKRAGTPPAPIPTGLRDTPVPWRAPAVMTATGFLLPGLGVAETRAQWVPLQLLEAVLGEGKACRLFALRDRDSLVYEVRTLLIPGWQGTLLAAITIGEGPHTAAREGVLRILKSPEPITTAEMTRARALLKGRHRLERQRALSRARAIAWNVAQGLSADLDGDFAARIDAVTLDELNALARRLLATQSVTVTTQPP